MASGFAFAFAGALLMVLPNGKNAAPTPRDDLTRVQILAAFAGEVLGAAERCDQIPTSRIVTAAKEIEGIVERSAADVEDIDYARTLYTAGIADGRRSIDAGELKCGWAEGGLAAIEGFIDKLRTAHRLSQNL